MGKISIKFFFLIFLTGCASPYVVQPVKPGDSRLSCAQLENEFADADKFRQDAESEEGVTGSNVARFIIFWPTVIGTHWNTEEAVKAANKRKVHLIKIMNSKGCEIK